MRCGSLGAMAMPMRPKPSPTVGSPPVSGCQVLPPSADLNSPLPGPLNDSPISQGAWRAAHSTAYTVCASEGSKARSTAPVFSSL